MAVATPPTARGSRPSPPRPRRPPQVGGDDGLGDIGDLGESGDERLQHSADAHLAAVLLAIDPLGLGGVVLRGPADPLRDGWLAQLRALLPAHWPWRRVPLGIADGRLLGGLDLPATLAAGRPVAERGLLAEADGGVVVLAMAERLPTGTVARITAALDDGCLRLARDGVLATQAARFAVVALDEGLDDEGIAPALADRLAFRIAGAALLPDTRAALAPDTATEVPPPLLDAVTLAAARARLPTVETPDTVIAGLALTAARLGVASPRALWLACRAARAAAALDGRGDVRVDDARLATRLVLAPRATRLPSEDDAEPDASPPPEPAEADTDAQPDPPPPPPAEATADAAPPPPPAADADTEAPADTRPQPVPEQALEDVLLAAATAAIPADLLARLKAGAAAGAARAAGRAGAVQKAATRGRPVGSRRGELRAGSRLALIDTLRAAAPWQPLRRAEQARRNPRAAAVPAVLVRREDFHIQRLEQKRETTTIFVVDASGSAALHRLAEAKGAVELLLADCYVRRDRVAVIAFRGSTAELLLPPTRSLVRAKRSLAGLPGGGGTPLALALEAASDLADTLARRGETPGLVLLTDGRANIDRSGRPGRVQAEADARAAARRLAVAGHAVLFIDTAPRPQTAAADLAATMRARYLPLPYADARALSAAVRSGLATAT